MGRVGLVQRYGGAFRSLAESLGDMTDGME